MKLVSRPLQIIQGPRAIVASPLRADTRPLPGQAKAPIESPELRRLAIENAWHLAMGKTPNWRTFTISGHQPATGSYSGATSTH